MWRNIMLNYVFIFFCLCFCAVCLATSATDQTGSWSKWTSDSLSPVSVLSPTTTPGCSQTCRWWTHTYTYLKRNVLLSETEFSLLNVYPQGDKCIMGQERSFRKRKDTAFCIKGKSYTSALTTKPCQCSEKDFNWWDYRSIENPSQTPD